MISAIYTHSVNGWNASPLQTQATHFINNVADIDSFRAFSSFHCFGDKKTLEKLSKTATEKGAVIVKPSQVFSGEKELQVFMDFLNYEKFRNSTSGTRFRVLVITNEVDVLTRGIHKCKCGIPVVGENSLSEDKDKCLTALV